jgi:hypothetical protein
MGYVGTMSESPYITITQDTIGERYADLRIIQPSAEKAMKRSKQNYGQLTPVVVGKRSEKEEIQGRILIITYFINIPFCSNSRQ